MDIDLGHMYTPHSAFPIKDFRAWCPRWKIIFRYRALRMSEVKFNVSLNHESQLSQLKFRDCGCCNVEDVKDVY